MAMNTKTVIVSGSRTITDYQVVKEAIESSPWFGAIDTVYIGDAKGVDTLALRWCKENGITYRIFKANWGLYGRGAGPERNREMILEGGEAVVAVWDGESKGTRNMLALAKRFDLPVHPAILKDEIERRRG